MQPKIKLAVFASGGGSNLQVIIDGCADETIDASVSVFVCNDPSAHSIQRAKNHGIPVIVLPNREFRTREKHEEAILKELDRFDFDFIALAGYMRIFTPGFIDKFYDARLKHSKIINIHPALLPKYPGAHAYEDAFRAKEEFSGITVHFVDGGIDTGQVILQAKVPILETDTFDDFKSRGLSIEHQVYPLAINHIADKVRLC